MAIGVFVPGPADIKVGSGTGGALEELGYTARGADVRIQGYSVDVPGDQNGGEQGPPIEIEHLGTSAIVRIELTKFDKAVLDKLKAGLRGITPAAVPDAGTLVFADARHFQLLIDSPGDPHWFPRATLVKQPKEYNVGTLYQRAVVEFECFRDPTTKVLYNTSYASTSTTAAATSTTAGG